MASDFSGLIQILITLGFVWYFFRKIFRKSEQAKKAKQASDAANSANLTQTQADEEDDDELDEEFIKWQVEDVEKEDEEYEEETIPVVPEPEPETVSGSASLTQLTQAQEYSSQQKAGESLSVFKYTGETTPETMAESSPESNPLFSSTTDLQRAILLKEILDKPKGLRGFQDNDW